MWTQEMIAFAFHNNRTTLYPPRKNPFARHCSAGHASDNLHKDCANRSGGGMGGGHAFVFDAQTKITIFNWGGHSVTTAEAAYDAAWVKRERDLACNPSAARCSPLPHSYASWNWKGTGMATALSRHVYGGGLVHSENASVTMLGSDEEVRQAAPRPSRPAPQLRQGAALTDLCGTLRCWAACLLIPGPHGQEGTSAPRG